MTALNAFVTPDRAEIWTDGAFIDEDGRLAAAASKILTYPEMPAVIAVAGAGHLTAAVTAAMWGRFATYDEMADGAADTLRDAPGMADTLTPNVIAMVGWSDRRCRMAGHLFVSSDNDGLGLKAWQRGEIWRVLIPNPPSFAQALQGAGIDVMHEAPLSFDEGQTIIRAQRNLLLDRPGAEPVRSVGCWAQHTIITRDGIETRRVERWPDEKGQFLARPPKRPGSARDPFRLGATGIPAFG